MTEHRQALKEAGLVLAHEFVFPNTNYLPAELAEEAVDAAIPGFVGQDLGFPERRPGLGPGRVPGATVPDLSAVGLAEVEAAVHKHRGLALGLPNRQ